jgi:hypothetical protein
MEIRMNRPILICAMILASAVALAAQQASQTSPYEGMSTPPANDEIITSTTPEAKPPAGKPYEAQPATPSQIQAQPQVHAPDPTPYYPNSGTDDGIVQIAPSAPAQPGMNRAYVNDPDGDIVHPHPLRRGELQEGTTIRVRLLERLSTTAVEPGQSFRTRVTADVLQGGEMLLPAGTEIDGRVAQVSTGRVGGHGSMRLQPETVILPDGTRYTLHAQISGTAGSHSHIVGEGTIVPGSRIKRDGIEYGAAVGAGVITGAIVAGPAGAVTGGLIGAGAITVHLLVNHPQATLDKGSTLLFTLTDRLYLPPHESAGN